MVRAIMERLRGQARLVAVSKNVSEREVLELFSQGVIEFGENRVQELKRKKEVLSSLALQWHFIGRLQSNKINQLLALRPCMWQSCESVEMALAVDKRLNYRLDTLLQINSANEESKQGVSAEEAKESFLAIKERCKNINPVGVMSIGAHSQERSAIKKSFETTFKIYESLRAHGASVCSMGMSGDFELALECGSNMVRLGTILYKGKE